MNGRKKKDATCLTANCEFYCCSGRSHLLQVINREAESYVSHHQTMHAPRLLTVCRNVSQKWREWRCRRL